MKIMKKEDSQSPLVSEGDVGLNEQLIFSNSGRKYLDEDKQAVLCEILRCAVCLEVPKSKQNQVKTCEKGHHFCGPCHKKLRSCAICRGRLYQGRNFVVEELISKLGCELGLNKHLAPPVYQTPPYCPGRYPCLICKMCVPSGRMIHHLRKTHANQLVDNKRSNPFSGRFDWMFTLGNMTSNVLWSHAMWVSDMGIYFLVIHKRDGLLKTWIQMVADDNISKLFRYRLSFKKIKDDNIISEFNIHNVPVMSCSLSAEQCPNDNILTFNFDELMLNNDDEGLVIVLSIWKVFVEGEKEFPKTILVGLPDDSIIFLNDRKTRRNRRRNFRKKRNKSKFKMVNDLEKELSNLTTVTNDEKT